MLAKFGWLDRQASKWAYAKTAAARYLLKLVALVGDQNVQHALVQEDGVEVVVPEEDCQLVGTQALPE